ncbi:hypothetical protein GALL_159940 [mine drainage metagenome]|uniref:Uncharacterized protein n=1 Tax=mine drainage metagenome TaxID=410659 RepID=A0A1J5S1N0_9ZZZZ
MQDVILKLVDVPMVRMFVLAGIIFLMIAVLGKIEGKIEPGSIGRIGSAILGVVLIAIGIMMQYGETHDVYAKLPPNMIAALPPQTVISVPASAPANVETTTIKVLSGTYGRNCNAKAGNATAPLSKACDGRGSCDFSIDTSVLEDPAPNCSKDFAAEWKCGSGNAVYSAALSSLTGKNDKLRLNCAN